MKAVFLDRATFSPEVTIKAPTQIADYQEFSVTEQDNAIIRERCKNADIIIANKIDFNKNLLQQLPHLKLLQITATGTNNVDKHACAELGIVCQNVAGYAVKSVPEHTFMLMLNAMRAGIHYHETVTGTTWQNAGTFCLMDKTIFDLEGKTLGIIGAGTIGRRVAEIARVFGMQVLYAEHQGSTPRSNKYTDFDSVLAQADIISLHCPLTEATEELINQTTIAKMQRQPLIINVARGGVVNSQAIVDALEKEQILGYASDVFIKEPIVDSDALRTLAQHPRVIFSPHNAWGSLSAQQELWNIASTQIDEFIKQYPQSTQ